MHRILIACLLLRGGASPETGHPFMQVMQEQRYTWDLTALYPSVEAWNLERESVLAEAGRIGERKGTLGDSADALYRALSQVSAVYEVAGRVSAWASLMRDEDLRDAASEERNQLAAAMYARLSEATAWMAPEILRVGRERISGFLREDARLAPFAHQLDDTLRSAPHTLGDEAEATLAYFSRPFGAPSNIYGLLQNSDIPFPALTLADGREHRIDSQGYNLWRASANREDRKRVFDAYWGTWLAYRNTVGTVLNSHIQTQVSLARARRHQSVLDRELFEDNIPRGVYTTLVREVNEALPTLHRYFRLRARMLGVDQMQYYDIYPPLISLEGEFDIETSKEITLEAMSLLGEDWVGRQREGVDERWMHVFPERGKRSGAYMRSVYGVHPYLLLNHGNDYPSLSTFAHEWGHAMHTLYAEESQPFQTSRYATFIAEIPSTSVELILEEYMVRNAASSQEKLFYLGQGLEKLRGTFFRQTMFAEFEAALYEAAERGEALSGTRISEIYGGIVRRYHGHDDGVVVIDDLYTNEWMFVPHFYANMYVYQYATSLTAGTALYDRILEEGASGVANYIDLLRAGGSDYPYNLLTRAGVDLASPEPYRAVVARMNAIMDEMEALLEADGR